MKSFLIKWAVLLAVYTSCFQLTKVIEIMTWDPTLNVNPRNTQNLPESLQETLEDSYSRGKMLSEEDTEGFYLSLQEGNIQFFAPNKFSGYAISFANFQGLLADQSNLHYPEVEDLVRKLSIKKAYPDSQDEYTLEVADDEMGSTFRVIENSLLLESSQFNCSNKFNYIQKNIKETPEDIKKACAAAAEAAGKGVTAILQELMDIYRSTEENRNVNLENCVEQFTLATYFSNDLLIKMNAGELLHEVAQIFNSTHNTTTKFFSYMTQNEVFLGVLTVIQKVARSVIKRRDSTISYNLYWGSLQHFRTKLSLEMYRNVTSGTKKVKVRISDWGGQLLFSMDLTLERFLEEVAPFMVSDYNHFQKVCNAEVASNIDLKLLLLPKDYTQRFNNLTMQLTLLVAATCIVIIILAISFRSVKKRTLSRSNTAVGANNNTENDNGSFQMIRNEDYNQDDSPESRDHHLHSIKDEETDLRGV